MSFVDQARFLDELGQCFVGRVETNANRGTS